MYMNKEAYLEDIGQWFSSAPLEIQNMMAAEENYLKEGIGLEDTVLECGSGNGRVLNLLSELADTVIGIDFTHAQIESSKKNAAQGNVGVILCDMMNLPFKEGVFDSATLMFNTIGGFDDIEKLRVLKEIKRVLKKGGKLILSAYAENAHPYQKEFYANLGYTSHCKDGITYAVKGDEIFKSETFTGKKLERLLREGGFESVEITRAYHFLYIAELVK